MSAGWYATAVLTAAYILSFVDRQLLTLLVAPIKSDLNLNDTEVSLLIGAAFAVCYTTVGIPIGVLADRVNRKRLAALGVAFWSVATALSGLASGYLPLFAARMGVGLGEATLTPTTYSLLADSFEPGKLVRAIGIYMSGAIVGVAAAYMIGGHLAAWVTAHHHISLPVIGKVRGWQAPFIVLLVPGLALSGLILLIDEPARRTADKSKSRTPLLPFVRSRTGVFGLLFLAMGTQSVIVYANLSWMPSLLARRFNWDPASIGLALGSVFFFAGLTGNLLGALLGGRLVERGHTRAYLGTCAASSGLVAVVGTVGPIASASWEVLALLAPTIFLTSVPTAIVPTAIQLATPGVYRGRVAASYLFATQMLGLILGPTTVALFTDFVFHDTMAVGSSQAATVLLASVISCAAFLAAARPFDRLLKAGQGDLIN